MADDESLVLEDNEVALLLFGQGDRNLRALEKETGIQVRARGNRVRLSGPALECKLARRVLQDLYETAASGVEIDERDVRNMARMASEGLAPAGRAVAEGDVIEVGRRRKRIVPRTANQRLYVQCIRDGDLTFGIGPAGTGKTYLAMAMAVQALRRREVARIVLTRPAVEAGERLGFLPGTLHEKVDPYLRPLTDALSEMMDGDEVHRHMERGSIEIAPLAYMRGRTLNDAFIILDEGQNTTSEQMRMFLTRLGFDSKAVINGDLTQTDLPREMRSGLFQASRILAGIPGIAFVGFDEKDVVRHPLVQEIIRAYENGDEPRETGSDRGE
ncbi:MAG: PhoH family protein [Proteobacteria bacterium]|nr:PhoH family protein [Pseudomonadota bacterium]